MRGEAPSMKKRYFTFLYIPDTTSSPRTIKIRRLWVYALGALLLLGAIGTSFALVGYLGKVREVYRLSMLEKENQVLRENLEELDSQVSLLKQQVARNFDFQKKARLLADLEEIDEDVAAAGAGGPTFSYPKSLSLLDDENRNELTKLGGEIAQLLRQAKLQEQSYQEILGGMSERIKELRSTPSICPVRHGFVSSRFGRRMDPFTGRLSRHLGVDYSSRFGAPVYAAADGLVTYARRWSSFGNVVEISHGNGYVTRYAHISKILVRKGQRVKRGDVIARVGSTGKSTAAHLHYEVLYKGEHRNPLAYVLPSGEVVD